MNKKKTAPKSVVTSVRLGDPGRFIMHAFSDEIGWNPTDSINWALRFTYHATHQSAVDGTARDPTDVQAGIAEMLADYKRAKYLHQLNKNTFL